MFDQSLFNSLVRGLAVLCDGTVVNARLGNGGLAVRQSPVSQLSLRPSWQAEAEPDADERDYAIAALAVKRAGRPVRTAGVLSSRTRHGEGTSLTAAIGTELSRSGNDGIRGQDLSHDPAELASQCPLNGNDASLPGHRQTSRPYAAGFATGTGFVKA